MNLDVSYLAVRSVATGLKICVAEVSLQLQRLPAEWAPYVVPVPTHAPLRACLFRPCVTGSRIVRHMSHL